jgi:hypothetical protein
VDVATGWCEAAAVLGRSYLVVRDGFLRCLARLPFPVLELHTDNGSEFFSAHLERFYAEYLSGAQRSRNRPYQISMPASWSSAWNAARNGDLIRRYLGDERLDTAAQTILLNALYVTLSRYHNLFQPVLRLQSKTLSEDGGRIRRRYSPPRPPSRACAPPRGRPRTGGSPLRSVSAWGSCGSRPTLGSCAASSMPNWTRSGGCPPWRGAARGRLRDAMRSHHSRERRGPSPVTSSYDGTSAPR